ncbi:hypothetical protein [Streptomyces sp. NPDC002088]|uniref:hypothetical protein n=1 Tax=Streptomyces sp. NPDC002088 TaxID=3154665 RepID=UPI00331F0759
MRRTARLLSVVSLAGAAIVTGAPAASADPAAQVSPSTLAPGGNVAVPVPCDDPGGFPTETDQVGGPAHRGTARIAADEDFAGEPDAVGTNSGGTVDGTCPGPADDTGQSCGDEQGTSCESGTGGDGGRDSGTGSESGGGGDSGVGSGRDSDGGGDSGAGTGSESGGGGDSGVGSGRDSDGGGDSGVGSGRDSGGDSSQSCAEAHTEPRTETPTGPRTDACSGAAAMPHGVEAGEGGAFTGSVPALVAGGLFIAGALGAAAHRLWHRGSTREY